MMVNKQSRTTFRKRMEELISELREEIWTGKYEVGDLLPTEAELADRFSLSKNSVRKALDALVAEELIEKNPRIGAKVSSPSGKRTITLRLGCYKGMAQEADLKNILSSFHDRHPNVRVQTIQLPYSSYLDTVKEYIANDLLDVIMVSHADFDFFCQEGEAKLLEELEPNPNLYLFLADAFKYGGKRLALPFIFSPIILCYNKTHFAEFNVPEPDSSWTWNELLNAAKKLSAKEGRYGFYFHLLSSNRWPVLLMQNGYQFRENKDTGGIYDPALLMESLDYCRKLVTDQGISPNFLSESDADAEELFLQGKVSIIMSTYYSLNRFRNTDLNFDVAPLPYIRDPRTLLLATGLAVCRQSKEKEAARLLLDFLLSNSSQELIRRNTLSIPAVKRVAEWTGVEQINRPSRYFMYREIIPSFRFLNELGLSTKDVLRVRQELKLFWSKIENAEEAYQRLESVLFNYASSPR